MTISISLVLILGVAVWIMHRYAGLKFLHALVCFLFGFLMAAAHQSVPSPEAEALRDEIQTCVRQLSQYRATLDNGGDPTVVSQWITETQARKLAAEARLAVSQRATPRRMTEEEITALVNTITDVVTVLRDADPHDKADLYGQLGLKLTYNPSARTLTARANLRDTCAKGSCPRGDLNSRDTGHTGQ